MSKVLGLYCKAYYLRDLRGFSAWHERADQARPVAENSNTPRTLENDSIVYLQADFSVTDGIFLNEHVLFAGNAPDWQQFCSETLGFVIPDDVLEAERQVQKDLESLQPA